MPAVEYYDLHGVRHLICGCGHDWVPKTTTPKQCPRCKTPTKLMNVEHTVCEWLSDDEKYSLCDDCRVEIAVVKHEGKKLCVKCLRKLQMI